MRTSFHHQPEAQHPNFPLSTSRQADNHLIAGVVVLLILLGVVLYGVAKTVTHVANTTTSADTTGQGAPATACLALSCLRTTSGTQKHNGSYAPPI
jgi:hypothetical protein